MGLQQRPLYRWKSFGFGLLFLAFLGYAWVRSMSDIEGVLWLNGQLSLSAGQSTGALFFAWDHSRPPSTFRMLQWLHEATPISPEPWFPKALTWETYDRQLQVSVAHWFVILLFLLPWSGWLARRWWRMKRLEKSEIAEPEAGS